MATNLWYICSVCMDNGRLTDADFHCQNCGKYYCDECLSLHNQMYKKHTAHGIYENEKWPGAKGVEELFTQCEEHGGNHIKMFCEDHSQLCCSTCVLIDHR
ncbi:hypothetical protein DPMN_000170 [Dreissena polymorpha]|uniref:B box-type domain-containing protein n=1 Tax=Dreissena polymorpha TaxID=45954 RepID=A0A9D4RPA0_DREPO|nr:hypothetical protein DPMN_000170 [Dreissena polymorpha]